MLSIRGLGELCLKALSCCGMCLVTTASASAEDLVVGAVRDRDGYAVEGAQVRLTSRDGSSLGHAVSAGDGTFAVELARRPDRIAIACRFCADLEQPFDSTQPIVVVRRYRRVPLGAPSVSDTAALPPRSLADLAALTPFAVQNGQTVSDRGLRLGADATALDGIGLYRSVDNAPLSSLVPGQLIASVHETNSVFEATSSAPDAPYLRLGTANAGGSALREPGDPAVSIGRSYADASAIAATGVAPIEHGTIGGTLLAASGAAGNLTGLSSASHIDLENIDVAAAVTILRSTYAGVSESDTSFDAHVTGRAAVALTGGIRGTTVTAGSGPASAVRIEDAAYGLERTQFGATTLTAGLSADPRIDMFLGASAPLTPGIRLAASFGQYPQTAPLLLLTRQPRADLIDVSAEASGGRFDTRLTAFSERTAQSGNPVSSGIGLAFNYQLSPQITLRSWALASVRETSTVYGPESFNYRTVATSDAGLLWLTYANGLRFDVVYRSGLPDASVFVPITRAAGISAGSHAAHGGRELSIDLVAH